MKKFILGSLSFIGLLGFTSCGGASTEAPNSSVSADTTKSKKVEIVESKEPQTACDCFEKWNPEIEKLLNTSMKELAEKPLLFKDFGEKISNDERCEKLTSKFDNDEEAMKDECPAGKKFFNNMKKFKDLANQNNNEPEELDEYEAEDY